MSPRILFLFFLVATPARAESFKAWAARAAREEREKNAKDAFESYSNALSSWKESDGSAGKARVLCARAALRDRGGDESGALEDYSGCLALDKKNSKAFDRRGELRLKAGRLSPAIDDLDKAIALDIDFAAAYADRARAYELQHDSGFAYEDYRRACELGAQAACPKARELAPARKTGAEKKPRAAAPKPAPQVRRAPRTPPAYAPRFSDCLDSARSCAAAGNAYGTCVSKAPACERKAVKGCCPLACLDAYRKALDGGASEASAYRDVFSPAASCALIDKR